MVLVIGNLGYVSSSVRSEGFFSNQTLGLDAGYFLHDVIDDEGHGNDLNTQIYADVRNINKDMLKGFNTIVYLAALSNDPMGNRFEKATMDINCDSAFKIAKIAKELGTKRFIFASSCSVYGICDGIANENTPANPLTAYAKSKYGAEQKLKEIADSTFKVICCRFATAAGPSKRLRLDLMINDFVINALANDEIKILSDGTPWRPIIDVRDMMNVIKWSSEFDFADSFTVFNAGTSKNNFRVIEFAEMVQKITGCKISVNKDNPADSRSYNVDFSKFEKLSGSKIIKYGIMDTIKDTVEQIKALDPKVIFVNKDKFIRLKKLNKLIDNNIIFL